MRRQLIINADDFGLTPGVTEGIIYCSQSGCVTSTSVMVNHLMHQRISVNSSTKDYLGMGVHLNLTSGKPILPPEDLNTMVKPDGEFIGVDYLFQHPDLVNIIQVEKEWRAQIIGFLVKFGRPDHLDSHHHIHLLPRFFQVFLQIAEEMRIPIRFPVLMNELEGFPSDSLLSGLSNDIAEEMLADDLALLERSSVRFPDYFVDDFITPNIDQPEKLNEFIQHLPEGVTEMICHPGYLDDLLFQVSSYTQIRVDELKAITAPQLAGLFAHEQIDLISFGKI